MRYGDAAHEGFHNGAMKIHEAHLKCMTTSTTYLDISGKKSIN